MGTVSGQSVDNAASKASYTITGGPSTVGGAFVATVATGTGGLLIGGGAFTGGDKAVDTDDTLNVTVTSTLASA